MKILVATTEGQGVRADDFFFAHEGDIVIISDCDHLHEGCGCQRSTVGGRSGKGTTTMMVVETDLTPAQFRREIIDANKEYILLGIQESVFTAQAVALLQLAKELPLGVVIERDGEDFRARAIESSLRI